ncbi:MAG: Ig-like domain-containing protein [Fibromonadaceae bacterium]|nr:Ig-like domain-containing protein [Fibromonadaceae bacterium]
MERDRIENGELRMENSFTNSGSFCKNSQFSILNSQLSKTLCILIIIGVQTILSCATVAPPSGGPEDKLPPRVSGSTLVPNSRNQSVNLDLTLQFDEWIIQKPPSGAVAISPPISGRLQIKAKGDKLRIYSTEPLDSNTTYTLTVTNAIKDLRNNPLEKPFQILFSTGDILDSLQTDFSVLLHDSLTRKKKFPVVAFYPIGEVRAQKKYLERFRDSTLTADIDTFPNITREIPLYIAQADSLGKGTLQGMQAGTYLAVAFLDENNNQRLNVETEIAGIANFPFELTEEKKLLRFSLGDLDTSSVTLEAVTQRGNREIELAFSRNIVLDSLFLQKDNCFFTTLSKDTIFHSDFYTEPNNKNTVLVIDGLRNDTLYTATCLYARDSLGRMLDTTRNTAKFRFKRIPDNEVPPTTISKMEPSSRTATDFLPGHPIKLYFNRPVSADTLQFRIYVNEDSVNVEVKQIDAIHLEIYSNPPFGTDSKIKLDQVIKDTIVDTLFRERTLVQFSTISRLKLASLKGNIPGGNAQTIVVLQETTIDRGRRTSIRTLGREFSAKCNEAGDFEMEGLPAGTYRLLYFKDLNGDGRLNSGSVWPLSAGEPWISPEEELILPGGDDNFLKELIKDLPSL